MNELRQNHSESQESLDRLSRIETQWTLIFEAHGRADANRARSQLVLRYHRAVFQYLLGAVRNQDAAEDLAQEFAIRMMRGDFHRASPDRGRFRQYLKTSIINLVNTHFQQQGNRPRTLPDHAAGPVAPAELESAATEELDFNALWRSELLEQTWRSLNKANKMYYNVLSMAAADQSLKAQEIAERLSTPQKQITSASVRQTRKRAREKFAQLLIDEVASTIEDVAPSSLHDELEAMDLLPYCEDVYQRWVRRRWS